MHDLSEGFEICRVGRRNGYLESVWIEIGEGTEKMGEQSGIYIGHRKFRTRKPVNALHSATLCDGGVKSEKKDDEREE